jgi:hypothetical protein
VQVSRANYNPRLCGNSHANTDQIQQIVLAARAKQTKPDPATDVEYARMLTFILSIIRSRRNGGQTTAQVRLDSSNLGRYLLVFIYGRHQLPPTRIFAWTDGRAGNLNLGLSVDQSDRPLPMLKQRVLCA